MRKLLLTLMVVSLLGPFAAEAARTKRTTGKTASKAASAKRTSAGKKKATASRRTSRKATASAASSPRPRRPTAERYMEVQQALAAKGFYTGPVDGVWNADCVQALKRFQESENLAVDGKLGAKSIIALGLGPQRSAEAQFLLKPPAEADDLP